MGQAKMRGTYAERREQGLARRIAQEEAERKAEEEKERNLTPEQREERRKARELLAIMSGFSSWR